MFIATYGLAQWLSRETHDKLDLVDAGKLEAANNRIKAARKTIYPQRGAISNAVKKLIHLEADFNKSLWRNLGHEHAAFAMQMPILNFVIRRQGKLRHKHERDAFLERKRLRCPLR